MRIRFTVYKHAPLATLCSCLGSVIGGMMVLGGVTAVLSAEVIPGLILAAIGAGFMIGSSALSEKMAENSAFRRWWKKVKKENLEPKIAESVDVAVQIYKINPQEKTLKKISALNPAAGEYIRRNIAGRTPISSANGAKHSSDRSEKL